MNQTAKDGGSYLDSPICNFIQVKPLDFQGKNFNLFSNDNPTHMQDSVRKSYNKSQNARYNESVKTREHQNTSQSSKNRQNNPVFQTTFIG